MMIKNKNCNLYYYTLKGLFPFIGIQEGKFLRDVKMQLQEFAILHPKCDYREILSFFGSPEDVFKDYVNSQGAEAFSQKATINKKVHVILDVILITILVVGIFIASLYWRAYKEFHNNLEYTSETEIDPGEITYE